MQTISKSHAPMAFAISTPHIPLDATSLAATQNTSTASRSVTARGTGCANASRSATTHSLHHYSTASKAIKRHAAGSMRYNTPTMTKAASRKEIKPRGLGCNNERHPIHAASRTTSASLSSVCCMSTTSSASTVIRTTGSVPEGRKNTRPRPCTAACASTNA